AGEVKLTIADRSGNAVRTLTAPGTTGLHVAQWNLETDAAQAQVQSEGGRGGGDRSAVTLSERQRQRRVSPGEYAVTLTAGGTSLSRPVQVRAESDDVRRVLPRK